MRIKFGTIEKYCENCDEPCDSPHSALISVWVDTVWENNRSAGEYVRAEFALCGVCANKLLGLQRNYPRLRWKET